jgi:anaerobic magnesium-protoporphyrin IX monomethyl ester cyclase
MGSGRPLVVLYNPIAGFHTIPLALIALGSALKHEGIDVRIIDGRVEPDAQAAVIAATRDAVCLGVTALTGAPLRDALRVTRAVSAAHPALPIIWGGWHPSLFPVETLREAGITATVQGQGERPLLEIVKRLAADHPAFAKTTGKLNDIPGVTSVGLDGTVQQTPALPAEDINHVPTADYGLVPIEAYFRLKGQRQLDYVSSQGCRFRCAFCADPTVFGRSWSGLSPERVGDELSWLARQYGAADVAFQDETFFTHTARVAGIAEALLARNTSLTWMATMRADQGTRLPADVFALCKRAGLRRVMVGMESGDQNMLDWMKKDATVEQVFTMADKCREAGIAVLCNLIVGFPGESDASVMATLRAAKRLRAYGPNFQIAMFYYRPYPGTPIADAVTREGYRGPSSLDEWSRFEDEAESSPWVSDEKRAMVDRFVFYQRIGWAPSSPLRAPLQALARWRCAHDNYRWPVEQRVLTALRSFSPQG